MFSILDAFSESVYFVTGLSLKIFRFTNARQIQVKSAAEMGCGAIS